MEGNTVNDILECAQALVQRRGYNAFSYRDVAAEVGIRGPTIHHHFPAKADLGVALVRRYRDGVNARLEAARLLPAPEALRTFGRLYQSVTTEDGRVCLNLMLAADLPTLPEAVAGEVRRSLDVCQAWLEDVLARGVESGHLRLRGTPRDEASALLALTEGAMLLARASSAPLRFSEIYDHAVEVLLA